MNSFLEGGWQDGQKNVSCPLTPSRRIVVPHLGQGSPFLFLTFRCSRTFTWMGRAASCTILAPQAITLPMASKSLPVSSSLNRPENVLG